MPLCGCRKEKAPPELLCARNSARGESNSCSHLNAMAKHNPMAPGNLFAELKRRNVYKVAVAYAVVGWLVIQIATSTFPVLEIPTWAAKLVIVAVVLGFPIALVIAWAFE